MKLDAGATVSCRRQDAHLHFLNQVTNSVSFTLHAVCTLKPCADQGCTQNDGKRVIYYLTSVLIQQFVLLLIPSVTKGVGKSTGAEIFEIATSKFLGVASFVL